MIAVMVADGFVIRDADTSVEAHTPNGLRLGCARLEMGSWAVYVGDDWLPTFAIRRKPDAVEQLRRVAQRLLDRGLR